MDMKGYQPCYWYYLFGDFLDYLIMLRGNRNSSV